MELGESWSSAAGALKVKMVDVSPEFGVHAKSTVGGAFDGGGGAGAVTRTTCDCVVVSPPVSIASMMTVLFPALWYWWLAVFVVDHCVSHTPSPCQSQRTWIVLERSWSSEAVAVKEKTVVLSPVDGVHVKSTVGGAFGGGGGELDCFHAVNGWSSQWLSSQ